jgi:hypothetical protein
LKGILQGCLFLLFVYGGFPPITAVNEGYLLRQAGVAEVAEVAGIAQEEKRGLTEPYWLSAQNTNATNLY